MTIRDTLENLVDKLTTGDRMQYVLAGTLVLIILVSLLSVILGLGEKSGASGMREMHFYCLETEKEFVLKPEDMRSDNPMMPDVMMGMEGPYARVMSPYTNERTAVPMTRCPNCEKWFVPEYYFEEPNPNQPLPLADIVCPYCGTNIAQWYREHRKRK